MITDVGNVTRMLDAASDGDRSAMQALWAALQVEIRQLAAAALSRDRTSINLQPTLVANEAFLRMFGSNADMPQWESRDHFFGCVWRVMRQFLVDYARSRNCVKRGSGRKAVNLKIAAGELGTLDTAADSVDDLLPALDRLRAEDPRQFEVLWRRFALGQTNEQVATALDVSLRTVVLDWRHAKVWLRHELEGSDNRD
ncbi:MAG: ECF-type sigma factor [Planctomycetota bacterium]|nr:ECF-type sigma factor [Planctomycetota bacterium]